MKAIVAMDLNRVIGYLGRIPWHLSDDLKWFKEKTLNSYLVMGRSTFNVVGPLPKRFIYVLTSYDTLRALEPTEDYRYVSLYDLRTKTILWNNMWVCGGAKTYQAMMPDCNEVYATIVLDEYDGDTFMPEFESQFPNSEILRETNKYWIVRYWK